MPGHLKSASADTPTAGCRMAVSRTPTESPPVHASQLKTTANTVMAAANNTSCDMTLRRDSRPASDRLSISIMPEG